MMKIGFKEVCINPEFPVNRMLGGKGKNQEVADDLHLRMLCIVPEEGKPFYHVSFDVVELWMDYRNRVKAAIEETVGQEIDLVLGATHSHNCPCATTDYAWQDFVLEKIRSNVADIELKEYEQCGYSYQYYYFNKVGDSREAGGDHFVVHLYAETLSLYGDGKRLGTVLMHNCHPTIKELWKDGFTAEYPGYCISQLKVQHPGEFFTFMLGPAGDISPHYVREKRDYDEIHVLGDKLIAEYERQLNNQTVHPIDKFQYREVIFPIETYDQPKGLDWERAAEVNEDETRMMDFFTGKRERPFRHPPRELEPQEYVTEHMISQLILSEDYSIIWEPFELYSEFYGAVDKQTTSLMTISNGFDHYLPGLYVYHVVNADLNGKFGVGMRRFMWELFGKLSRQVPTDQLKMSLWQNDNRM